MLGGLFFLFGDGTDYIWSVGVVVRASGRHPIGPGFNPLVYHFVFAYFGIFTNSPHNDFYSRGQLIFSISILYFCLVLATVVKYTPTNFTLALPSLLASHFGQHAKFLKFFEIFKNYLFAEPRI